MSNCDAKKVLTSINSIKNYITRLLLSTKHAIDIIINDLEVEFESHKIIEPLGYSDGKTISLYPYEYKEVVNALKIMENIKYLNSRNETDTTQFKDKIKELEQKLIEIHDSVKSES